MEAQNATLSEANRRVIDRRLNLALRACGLEDLVEGSSFGSGSSGRRGSLRDSGSSNTEVIEGLHRIASVNWDGRSYTCGISSSAESESMLGSSSEEDANQNRRSKACSPCGKLIADYPEIKSKLLAFARDLQLDEIERQFLQDLSGEKARSNPIAEDSAPMDKKAAFLEMQAKLWSSDLQPSKDPFCRERKVKTYEAIGKEFHDYKFSKVVDLAYPLEPCALLGLEQFVGEKRATHMSTRIIVK